MEKERDSFRSEVPPSPSKVFGEERHATPGFQGDHQHSLLATILQTWGHNSVLCGPYGMLQFAYKVSYSVCWLSMYKGFKCAQPVPNELKYSLVRSVISGEFLDPACVFSLALPHAFHFYQIIINILKLGYNIMILNIYF